MKNYDLTIPRRIVQKREALGLAGYELAKRAGISPSYLSLIENGLKLPSPRVAEDLARALGEDPDLFLAWVETAGGEDLDSRVERLERMREARSSGGMRDWQMARARPSADMPSLLSKLTHLGSRALGRGGERPEVLRVPLLPEGADPSDFPDVEETILLDPGLLDRDQDRDRLFAYRVSARFLANVGDAVSPGDVLVLAAGPAGVDPGAIYAVRVRSRIVLARIAYTRPTLFLMPGQPGEAPTPIPVRDERALRELLAGVAVACIRTWSKPAPSDPEDVGDLVRDCEWRENYGWRPVQKSDDLDYLLAHPGRRVRFRLLRDGDVKYVLEMNAEQWQEALGSYYGGSGWHRNGYIVAITKRKRGEYTEEFQERWAPYVREER